jgi:hypothetical protein
VTLGQFLYERHKSGAEFTSTGIPGVQPTFTKKEKRFAGWADMTIADACRTYLALLERLVSDFERKHPGT